MAHRPNIRPTLIYWLFDSRTSIPFYCGKTVLSLPKRLWCHHYDARKGTTPVNLKVRECGDFVEMRLIETVPPEGDWGVREKRWIDLLRGINPDCCNVTSGGQGCPGRIASAEARAKIVATWTGRKHSPETCAKISKSLTGRKRSPGAIAKQRAKVIGLKRSPDQRATISAAQKAKFAGPKGEELRAAIGRRSKNAIVSLETREKQRAAKLGKRRTPEERAKISASNMGKKMSAEAIARSAAARTGGKRTLEQRARMSAAHRGKPWSQAQRDAHKGKKWSESQRISIPAALVASWKRRKDTGQAVS